MEHWKDALLFPGGYRPRGEHYLIFDFRNPRSIINWLTTRWYSEKDVRYNILYDYPDIAGSPFWLGYIIPGQSEICRFYSPHQGEWVSAEMPEVLEASLAYAKAISGRASCT